MKNLLKTGLYTCALAMLMTGCGATETDALDEASLSAQQQEVCAVCDATETAEIAEHSCVHAQNGPFQAVTAAALGTTPMVDVNQPHTAYNVNLPGKSGNYGGSVIFTPEETTEYAFLLSRYHAVRIFDGKTEVAVECRGTIPSNVCSSLKAIHLADLEAGKDYRIEFRSLEKKNPKFTLVVEEAAHDHDHEG